MKTSLIVVLTAAVVILVVSDAPAATLMGRWDTDGDGALEDVYNNVASIRIVESNGTARSYAVGNNWALVRVADTDGVKGQEVVVNVGSSVRIISDRTSTVRNYFIGSNWWLVTVGDTDGKAGVELVFNLGLSVRIVRDASRVVKDYVVAANWVFLAIADTDGQAGDELVFNVLGGLRIIHDASGTASNYSLIAQTWVFMGAADTDGTPGSELLFNLGTTIRIFREAADGATTDRFVGFGSWALMDMVDTDGRAGDEIVVNLSGTVRILRDADGTSASHAVPLPWTYLGASQIDGFPGMELSFNTFGNVLFVIHDGRQAPEAPTATVTATYSPSPTFSPAPPPTSTLIPTPMSTPMPTWTMTPPPIPLSIRGQVRYVGNDMPIEGVEITVDGSTPDSMQTGPAGDYAFSDLAPGRWTIRARRQGGSTDAFNSRDAMWALEASVGGRELSPAQALACDVTGNGIVSSLDAARILQRVVGLMSVFPIAQACGSDLLILPVAGIWGAVIPMVQSGACQPAGFVFDPLTSSVDGADFEAAYFGDCTFDGGS